MWLYLEIKDYAIFGSYNEIENEAHLVLECALYNFSMDKFPSLFENVQLGNLESFFQLDQQVDISLYLMKATALRNSKKITSLKPS